MEGKKKSSRSAFLVTFVCLLSSTQLRKNKKGKPHHAPAAAAALLLPLPVEGLLWPGVDLGSFSAAGGHTPRAPS